MARSEADPLDHTLKLAENDVRDARSATVRQRGRRRRWIMAVVKPGEIMGTLNVRHHTAVVTIPHTSKNYSIIYKDSSNLKYNAERQTIHQEYTYWIQRLDNEIRARLTAAGQ